MNKQPSFDTSTCPMPQVNFDVVTLGHGSGGVLTHRLLDDFIFQCLESEFYENGHDGAVLDLSGKVAFSTDSFVVSPIQFPGGNIGELAVNGTVNDLAMCGATPKYLSLSFILEEGLLLTELWEVLLGVKKACQEAGVKIATGDTKVVEKGKGDKIFVNTSGVGMLHPKADIKIENISVGDQVIVSGNIASHGVAILSVRDGLEFETTMQSDTASLNDLTTMLLEEHGHDIHFLRDPTRGGVATILNEIAQVGQFGVSLDEQKLPMTTAVEGACEMLGLDPLYVANEGIFVAVVSPEISASVVAELSKHSKSAGAAVIGEIVNDHQGQVVLQTVTGGRRPVTMLTGEQLPRIC